MAQFSFGHIFHIVSTQRGGGPLHFWLEHFLLRWWPGCPALRVPSLVFACLALPGAALVVRRLAGAEAAAGAVLLTAAAPIPVLYATFGRPHTLLFAWLMWSTVVVLRAADGGGPLVGRGRIPARSLGLRPPDGAALRLDGVRRRARLLPEAAARRRARGVAGCGGAVRRVRAVLREDVARPERPLRRGKRGGRAARSAAALSGRTRSTSSRRVVTTSTTSRFSRPLGVVALAVARRRRVLRVLCDHGRRPGHLLLGRPGERRLGGLLRPLHDPRHAGVLHRRHERLPRPGRSRRQAESSRRSCCSSAGCSRSSFATTHTIATSCARSTSTRSSRPWRRRRPARCCSARRGRAASSSRRSTTAIRRTSSITWSRFGCASSISSTTTRANARLSFVQGTVPRRAIWLFYAAGGPEVAAGEHAFDGAAGVTVQQVERHYFVVRSRSALPPRALIALGRSLRERWKRAVPANLRDRGAADRRPAAAAAAAALRALRRARRSRHLPALAPR